MNVERILAKYKRASAQYGCRKPTIERHSSSGFLSEWHTAHLKVGGNDAKVAKAENLVADQQAPLKLTGKKKKVPTLARGHLKRAAEYVQSYKDLHGVQTRPRHVWREQHNRGVQS